MHNLQPTLMRPEPVRAPPHGPVARLSESGSSSDPPVPIPMAFVNEIVSDADIDRYDLPFEKGAGRYWTRDKERDIYLWGGKGGNPAFGEEILGYFNLRMKEKNLKIAIRPGVGSDSYSEQPYCIEWAQIAYVDPPDWGGLSSKEVLSCLKEALSAYGDDGRKNRFAKNFIVRFDF